MGAPWTWSPAEEGRRDHGALGEKTKQVLKRCNLPLTARLS